MTAESDRIPFQEIYRGCRIHDNQPRERIETVIKPEIDRIFGISDPQELYKISDDASWSPEARLLCRTTLIAGWELATEGRMPRPDGITIDMIKARTAGLDSVRWRDPDYYGSALHRPRFDCPPGFRTGPVPTRREAPLSENDPR